MFTHPFQLLVMAAGVLLAVLPIAKLGIATGQLLRVRWDETHARLGSRRVATGHTLVLVGGGLVLFSSFGLIAGLAFPANVLAAAALLVGAAVVFPWLVAATKGARRPTPDEAAAIDRVLDEEWRQTAGVSVRVLPARDDGLRTSNGLAAGVLPGLRYVLVSAALFEELSDAEMDALLAHERGHIDEYHTAVLSALLAGVPVVAGGVWVILGFSDIVSLGLSVVLLSYVGGAFAVARRLEYRADAYAARLLRDPEGMIDLLGTLADRGDGSDEFVAPLAMIVRILATHPSDSERIARLQRS